MLILVLNSGSSSIKADIVHGETGAREFKLRIERLPDTPEIRMNGELLKFQGQGFDDALLFGLTQMKAALADVGISGVGHRVVHGGEKYSQPVIINDDVERTIKRLGALAPIHNPVNLKGIRLAKQVFPEVPHVAIFDTAFHRTLSARAQAYAIDHTLAEKHGIRRYGFHGTSHEYVAEEAARLLGTDVRQLRLITCHLGNGCSIAAVEYGKSVESSMGMTPLEGLVMGTRSGDIDPGVLIHLMKEEGWTADQLDEFLNNQCGLKGLSGIGNDMRDIIEKAAQGDRQCQLAIGVFAHRVRKYIGAYAAVMGGVDAIVFTGGIGENSAVMRHRICQRFDFLGAIIDEEINRELQLTAVDHIADFSTPSSRVKLIAVLTDEQWAIARQSLKLLLELDKVNRVPAIPIAISARHVHLTRDTLDALFGKGYELTSYKPLSQPGQYAANETVTIVGPKNRYENVRILGPLRAKDQVEISRTDEFFLGIDAPIRESGHTENTPGITLIGPVGKLAIREGVICAWRHIHMHPNDALAFGVIDQDLVEVVVSTPGRSLTFGNVLIRVSDQFHLEMHIDTDEGNAAEISSGQEGALVRCDTTATLKKKDVRHLSAV
jgi:acetate kinase